MTRRKTASTRTRGTKTASPRLLTPQRRRELAGALLLVLAVVTVISFVSHGGALTQRWLGALQWLLGWGAAIAPVAVGALGVWLVMHAGDEGGLRWERPLGGLIVFLSGLGLLHILAWLVTADERTARAVAEASDGGGWLGYAIANALTLNLGTAPSVATLVVIGMLGASMTLGRPLRETATMTADAIGRGLAALWASRPHLARRRSRRAELAARVSDAQVDPVAPDADSDPPIEVATEHVPEPEPVTAAAVGRKDQPQRWRLPPLDEILDTVPDSDTSQDDAEAMAKVIESTLGEFGIPATVIKINRGPAITQFGLEPGYVERGGQRSKVKVSRITSLQNDLALALAASPIRIQAPVPGRPYVGVEVPNSAMSLVSLRSVVESNAFAKVASKGALPIALGRDTSGRAVAADLAAMPHLLVAGATGSGKSVAINAIICALLMTHTPETLRMLLVDPKRVEMAQYRGLPHLASPVVVEIERVIGVLQWAVREMDRRYKAFADVGARNIVGYNQHVAGTGEPELPYLVLFIDELADLMMIAPEEAERLITRLAQLARATGIHLVLATQRPSVDVVTGLIKANFPSRIAFAVSSSIDSRVILDGSGAEKLLGRGDMLYQASDDSKQRRLQGCFVSDSEIDRLARYWKYSAAVRDDEQEPTETEAEPVFEPLIQAEMWDDMKGDGTDPAGPKSDDLFDDAEAIVREHHTASTSFLQRKLRVGYSRAARIIDELEEAGVVGPAQGNKPREVLAPQVGEAGTEDGIGDGVIVPGGKDGVPEGPDDLA